MTHWSKEQLAAHEYKLARKGIILHDQKPGNKYKNKKVEINGKIFDSKKEGARYKELLMLQKAGEITDLECQKTYSLWVNGVVICRYRSDFFYKRKNGLEIIEDVKGYKKGTAYKIFTIKKNLMYAIYGISVVEI